MKRPLAVLVLLCGTAASAAPHILLFPAIGSPTEVTVQGRVLKDAPTQGSSTLSRNLRRLTASDWEGAPVEVSFHGATVKTKSGDDGVFSATFVFPSAEAPTPGLKTATARVPGASRIAAVRVIDPRTPFVVISDFDDTVAVSNVTDRTQALSAALLHDGNTLPAVTGMNSLYQCLTEDGPALAFVSGSPHQYAPRISAFLNRHQFPVAGLYLRDFGLDTLSGYKQPVIRRLLRTFDQRVVLIGDSGEHDPEVYADIRREFPDRIAAIYIRDVGRSDDPKRFEGMTLFRDGAELARDAAKRGLIAESCRSRAFDVIEARK